MKVRQAQVTAKRMAGNRELTGAGAGSDTKLALPEE